jgi:hypothetical protein
MTKLLFLLALPLLPFAVHPWFTPSETMTTKISDDVRCEIRATPTSGGVQLRSIATASRAVSGEYEFVVEKQGGGGTSSTAQSGDFSVGPGTESLLSEVSLGLSGGATYVAQLTLYWNGAETSCTERYPQRT